jgi:hypothetical protein
MEPQLAVVEWQITSVFTVSKPVLFLLIVGVGHRSALSRPRSIRHWRLGQSQHRSNSIRTTDVEEHSLGDYPCHLSRPKVHDEKRLLAFDLAGIGSLSFHPGWDSAYVIAEADFERDQLLGIRNVGVIIADGCAELDTCTS